MANYESSMSDKMQSEALQVALQAMKMYEEDKDIARYIKTEFERMYGDSWQCSIGDRSYSVDSSYICFSAGGKKIALFRTG